MEGYLLKKGRGESKIFGRRNWKKRWFILEGQYLTYYEDFDRQNNCPVNQKGVAVVRGCDVKKIPHDNKQFCFVIKHEQRSPIYLCADKERLMYIWIDALNKAAKGVVPGPASINWAEYYETLNLLPEEEYSLTSLNKAYRKAALRSHPDKGGNVDLFKKVQVAFEMLQSKLEEEEQNKLYTTLSFTARIVKSPPPVGFGMVVVEDTTRGGINAKEVYDSIVIEWISPEAGGLQKGDRIVKIESDDIRTWSLARLVQRLSDFRVPVRSVVTFSFERRVRTGPETESDAERVNDPATVAEESSEDPVYFGADLTTTPPARPPLQTRLSITFQESSDAEEEDQQPQPQKEKEKGKREEEDSGTRWEFKTEREEMSRLSADGEPAVAIASPPLPRAAGLVSVSFPCAAQESEVGSGCSRQEVEKLQREIENLRRDLLAVSAQRDELLDELDDLRMKLEMTSGERNEFLRQLGDAEMECQELERRERDALALVEQMADQQAISERQSARFESNVQIAARSHLSPPHQTPRSSSVERARQSAFTAAALVDPDGKFSNPSSTNSGEGFLRRLEDSVLRPYCDSAPQPPLSSSPPPSSLSHEGSSPAPLLSLPQRLVNSRASSAAKREGQETAVQTAAEQKKEKKERADARERENRVSYQQIHRRVVSGLYIDSLRTESPKKSLSQKLAWPPSPGSGLSSSLSPGHSHSQRLPLDRSLSLSSAAQPPPFSKNAAPSAFPTRPTRRAPPSPAASHTPPGPRPGATPGAGPGGGASRGPQFYRDLLLTSPSHSSAGTLPQKYKSETTTESYLFSPPPPPPAVSWDSPSPSGASRGASRGERRAAPGPRASNLSLYNSISSSDHRSPHPRHPP